MKLQNTLSIPVPVQEAWKVLLDIERIAPCVPGATLTSHDGDRFGGKVKVKLGPIGLTYSGTVTFLSLDEAARTVVMEAGGRETRGGGTAKATITCTLTDHGDTTGVLVDTDLAITGRPAQFGRSTLADVAAGLIDQFATNLAAGLAGPPADGGGAAIGHTAVPAVQPPEQETPDENPPPPAEPIDLLRSAGGGLLERVGPIAAAAALLTLLLIILNRRRNTQGRKNA
ncbi:SRPBCC family protein [Actinocorallia sp. B10E7]|uniref:SRPBCC family protein n=1 Tax=Actinocorallia sp. B10E7 TaxID=3153558 RepID=UPI00325F46CC